MLKNNIYLGFDFGYKRIGVAVGQVITLHANPLATIKAKNGIPEWNNIAAIIDRWQPVALIVGLPVHIDGSEQYTAKAARAFAAQLTAHFSLPTNLVDERLTTVDARAQLFASGGYRKIVNTEVDGIAACIILEQWLYGLRDKNEAFFNN